MSYFNPSINTSPVANIGLDAAIEEIRSDIEALSWVEKMFGRSWHNLRHEEVQGTIERLANVFAYPGYYQGNGEYYDLLPNDNLKSYGFFKVESGARFPDWESGNFQVFTEQDLSAIVWFNMDKINKSLSDQIRFNEYLKMDVIRTLNANDLVTDVELVLDDTEQIFADYSFRDDQRQFLRHPFGALKVQFTVSYVLHCGGIDVESL